MENSFSVKNIDAQIDKNVDPDITLQSFYIAQNVLKVNKNI